MFDLGWTELLLIGIVALIVVGPKDLPLLFRKVGKFVGKARGMAREFSRAMDDAADEAGVKEVAKSLKVASAPIQAGLEKVKHATSDLAKYSPEGDSSEFATRAAKGARKGFKETERKNNKRKAAASNVPNTASSKKPIDNRKKKSKKSTIHAAKPSKD